MPINKHKLEAARINLVKRFPWCSASLYTLKFHKEIEGHGTVSTDKWWRVYWDPGLPWPMAEIEGVIMHELGHPLRRHFERCDDIKGDPNLFNVAGDCEINDDLVGLVQLPKGVVYPTTFQLPPNLTAEWYYEKLKEQAGEKDGCDGSCKEGDSKGNAPCPVHGTGEATGGKCGSIAGGELREWEDAKDTDCPSDEHIEQVVKETERQAGHSLGAGKETGEWKFIDPNRLRDALHNVWMATMQQEISKHVRLKGEGWMREDRRVSEPPFFLPGEEYLPPTIVFLVDVSGSIEEEAAKRAFAVTSRFEGMGVDCKVVACDTEAKVITKKSHNYSGGGTHMGTGLEFVKGKFRDVELCIVITDGQTPWCRKMPFPVVVFSWDRPGPSWCKNVAMPGWDGSPKPRWSEKQFARADRGMHG